MTRAALARFMHEWWPEMLCAAMLTAIAFAGQSDDWLFSVFCAIIGAIFWAMGHRHRRLPMQVTLDGVKQDVRETRDILLGLAEDAEPQAESPRPALRLVPTSASAGRRRSRNRVRA